MATRKPLTIVIKLGTSSIVSPTYPFLPLIGLLSSIVETVVKLRELGHRVVLCSSGAIGVGLRRMGVKERGKGLSHKQALAAIGQGRLIALWDNLFSQLDQPIAQILLTRMDISDRTRYLNAQNTFSELLQMGVVPIVNENDTVSVSEIKFGDNDTLSAISGAIVHADYLFLLTDVECLYTDNPRHNPSAKPVRVVRDVEKIRSQVSVATLGTSLGTGGMSTKLIAADLATAAGITTVIMRSDKVTDIFKIVENGPAPSRESATDANVEALEQGPLCTRFLRREVALKDRKWWIAHGLHSAGTVVIDEGALRAIKRKDSGYRILPAGVVRVEGTFASHQAVRIIVRKRRRKINGESSNRDSDECPTPDRGSREHLPIPRPPSLLVAATSNASSPDLGSAPLTPTIQPVMSLSSSIASLDPLSRTAPPSPGIHALAERLSISTVLGSNLRESTTLLDVPDVDDDDWEEQEVGKGLAQYNSAEIDRLKGMKSSHIESVLGYCDSEHVVDSITLWA